MAVSTRWRPPPRSMPVRRQKSLSATSGSLSCLQPSASFRSSGSLQDAGRGQTAVSINSWPASSVQGNVCQCHRCCSRRDSPFGITWVHEYAWPCTRYTQFSPVQTEGQLVLSHSLIGTTDDVFTTDKHQSGDQIGLLELQFAKSSEICSTNSRLRIQRHHSARHF